MWLVSRSTLAAASESLLRFVLLHDMGHRRYRHLLLSTLAGWAWVVIGLCTSHAVIRRAAPLMTSSLKMELPKVAAAKPHTIAASLGVYVSPLRK